MAPLSATMSTSSDTELGSGNPPAPDRLARDRRDAQEQLTHGLLLGASSWLYSDSARRATALRTPPMRS